MREQMISRIHDVMAEASEGTLALLCDSLEEIEAKDRAKGPGHVSLAAGHFEAQLLTPGPEGDLVDAAKSCAVSVAVR